MLECMEILSIALEKQINIYAVNELNTVKKEKLNAKTK